MLTGMGDGWIGIGDKAVMEVMIFWGGATAILFYIPCANYLANATEIPGILNPYLLSPVGDSSLEPWLNFKKIGTKRFNKLSENNNLP